MPTFNLGTASTSNRVAAFIKDSYEREKGESLTEAQIVTLIRQEERGRLALRVRREKQLQRNAANAAEDAALDGEITINAQT